MDKDPEKIKKAALAHTLHGTTGILPTMLSSPEEVLIDCADRIADVSKGFTDSNILGVHFEGPYMSPQMSGAQSDDAIFPVNVNSPLLSVQNLKMITMAPELQNANTEQERRQTTDFRILRTFTTQAHRPTRKVRSVWRAQLNPPLPMTNTPCRLSGIYVICR